MSLAGLEPVVASGFPNVAYIKAHFPRPHGAFDVGTGTLIAPRVVLTAGHVVYDDEQDGKAVVDVSFVGTDLPPFLGLTEVDFPMEWRKPRDELDRSLVSPVDIGVIVLPKGIDRFITPMLYQKASDSMLAGASNLVGFPANPPNNVPRGTLWGNRFQLLQGAALPDGMSQYESFRLFYQVDTLPGMSGGPLYTVDNQGIATLRGIHTCSLEGLGIGGSALRIDDNILSLLNAWVQQFPP